MNFEFELLYVARGLAVIAEMRVCILNYANPSARMIHNTPSRMYKYCGSDSPSFIRDAIERPSGGVEVKKGLIN